jgi:hypothetical protein
MAHMWELTFVPLALLIGIAWLVIRSAVKSGVRAARRGVYAA